MTSANRRPGWVIPTWPLSEQAVQRALPAVHFGLMLRRALRLDSDGHCCTPAGSVPCKPRASSYAEPALGQPAMGLAGLMNWCRLRDPAVLHPIYAQAMTL